RRFGAMDDRPADGRQLGRRRDGAPRRFVRRMDVVLLQPLLDVPVQKLGTIGGPALALGGGGGPALLENAGSGRSRRRARYARAPSIEMMSRSRSGSSVTEPTNFSIQRYCSRDDAGSTRR